METNNNTNTATTTTTDTSRKRKLNPIFALMGCPSCNEEVPVSIMRNYNGHPVCSDCLTSCYTCNKTFVSSLHICINKDEGFVPEFCSDECKAKSTP